MRILIVGAGLLALQACSLLREAGHDARLASPDEATEAQALLDVHDFPPGSKFKFTGPVTLTAQKGQYNSATSTAATKPHPETDNSTSTGIAGWQLLTAIVVVLLFVLWLFFGRRSKEREYG